MYSFCLNLFGIFIFDRASSSIIKIFIFDATVQFIFINNILSFIYILLTQKYKSFNVKFIFSYCVLIIKLCHLWSTCEHNKAYDITTRILVMNIFPNNLLP